MAGAFLCLDSLIPSIDEVVAPLASLIEFIDDDDSLVVSRDDVITSRVFIGGQTPIGTPKPSRMILIGRKPAQGLDASSDEEEEDEQEEAMEEGEKGGADSDTDDDDFEEEGDDDDDEGMEEYPGLGKNGHAASVGGAESYDFSVMDTELEEAKGGQKKRKAAAKNGGAPAKKKAKKAPRL